MPDGNINLGFNLDISEYANDDLNVMLTAKYTIKFDRFFGWRMSHPTKNLTYIINYPKEFSLIKEYFFSEDNLSFEQIDNTAGSFCLRINDWLLPDEGFAWQLRQI